MKSKIIIIISLIILFSVIIILSKDAPYISKEENVSVEDSVKLNNKKDVEEVNNINDELLKYNDSDYGFNLIYPTKMETKVSNETDLPILRNVYVKPSSTDIGNNNREMLQVSIIEGSIESVISLYEIQKYEAFSQAPIEINGIKGIKARYRDGFSGEFQINLILGLGTNKVVYMSYAESVSNDNSKFIANETMKLISESITLN